MIIGIDGSRAFVEERTGTENYSWEMLRAIGRIDNKNSYRIFIRRSQNPACLRSQEFRSQKWPGNFKFVEISWPKLWTQAGLALKTWIDELDLLWVPAHTLPFLGNPRLPMVVTIHGVEYEYLPGAYKFGPNWHLTWSTRWAVRRAQKIVAVSGRTKLDLVEKLGADGEKIEVVYEGVELNKFKVQSFGYAQDRRSKFKMRSQNILERYGLVKPYILFVGTVQPRKNLQRLIEAFVRICHPELDSGSRWDISFSQILKRVQHDVNLVIVGKMGWDYEDILATPKKFGVGDRVKFLGYVPDEDLAVLYQGASLYVEPSLQEGFGLPVLEAMASRVPVVAANAGALPEVVGDAGILVDPLSVDSLVEGILSGFDKKTREVLVKRGSDRVKKFTWEEAGRKLVKIFENIPS